MKKNTLTLLVSYLIASAVFSQTETTTKDGKKVLLFPDGTWKYAEAKIDTAKTKTPSTSDCSEWTETKTDKVTGNISTSGKSSVNVVSKSGGRNALFTINMTEITNSIILSIYAYGAGSCIDKGSKINILFTDGSRGELRTDGDFNCKKKAIVYFGDVFGKKKELNELKLKKIATMRVWTNDSYVELDFTQENQNEFLNVINCLTKSFSD